MTKIVLVAHYVFLLMFKWCNICEFDYVLIHFLASASSLISGAVQMRPEPSHTVF